MLCVVDHTNTLTHDTQTQANISILGQTVHIPAIDALEQISAYKNGISSQRNHTDSCMEVQPTFKPEKILQAVMNPKPMVIEVHQLNTTLHNPYTILDHHCIDHVKNIWVNIVLGIKNRDDLMGSTLQSHIETMWLIDRWIGKRLDTNERRANITNSTPRFSNRSRVTDMTNNDNL